jgi:NADPH:quinone reductase-like Zn-dependent oxidoreductase
MTSFQAWRVEKQLDGNFRGSEQTLSTETDLPAVVLAGDKEEEPNVLIQVSHSSLNFKDALSASGNKGVTRTFPHTPGIDAVGTLAESGKPVLVTGYDLGMNTDGGFLANTFVFPKSGS